MISATQKIAEHDYKTKSPLASNKMRIITEEDVSRAIQGIVDRENITDGVLVNEEVVFHMARTCCTKLSKKKQVQEQQQEIEEETNQRLANRKQRLRLCFTRGLTACLCGLGNVKVASASAVILGPNQRKANLSLHPLEPHLSLKLYF